jgi:ubiquitin-protein ligase
MAASIIQQKRFTNEKVLLAKEPLHYTTAYPDTTNPLIWHCLIIGQKGTPYHGGHYIYKVHHSPKYPAEPPDYYFLTPSGRYQVNQKICLTNSGYHKDEWSSTWNIKTILISFYSIFLDDKVSGISHIHDSPQICKDYASKSIDYNKKHHNDIYSKFDFTHLSDDVISTPITSIPPITHIPIAKEIEVMVPNPIPNAKVPVTSEVENPAVFDFPEVFEPKVATGIEAKIMKKNINIMDDSIVNDSFFDNIRDIDSKIKVQFDNIHNLEQDLIKFK